LCECEKSAKLWKLWWGRLEGDDRERFPNRARNICQKLKNRGRAPGQWAYFAVC